MPRIDWYQVPGYREAVERETAGRDAAFLPIEETLCGIPVRPFSMLHWTILAGIGSPFVCGGMPTADHALKFLWVVSRDFDPRARWRRNRFYARCRRRARSIDISQMMKWIDSALMDAPGGGSGRALPASFLAFAVDAFASEYGWSIKTVLDLPCQQVFQLIRCMRNRNDPKAVFINPSDKVKSAYLRSLTPDPVAPGTNN